MNWHQRGKRTALWGLVAAHNSGSGGAMPQDPLSQPGTDLPPLKQVLPWALDGNGGGIDAHLESHQAGFLQKSSQLPLKGQQPWDLKKRDTLINGLTKEMWSLGGQGEGSLRGHSGR